MWSVKKILRSFADAIDIGNWSRTVEALQGEWQGETKNGVSVGKAGRLVSWSAYGSDGDRLEIPPCSYAYSAMMFDGATMENASGTATGYPVPPNATSLTVRCKNRTFFIQGTFMVPLDVGGD
jgi:hypothetical protein